MTYIPNGRPRGRPKGKKIRRLTLVQSDSAGRLYLDATNLTHKLALAYAHTGMRSIAGDATLPASIRDEAAHIALGISKLVSALTQLEYYQEEE